jgi:glycosidase
MFSLPGTPVLFYGEELGMGEDLAIGSRLAVRTPMQWTRGPNGGFSEAPKGKLVRKVVGDGYSPEHVNVSDQRHDPGSLLHFMRTLVARYRSSPEMGWGQFELLEQPAETILAHSLAGAEGRMVALHNFCDAGAVAEFAVPDATGEHHLVDLIVDGRVVELDDGGRASVPMDGYGYRWFRVMGPEGKRLG